MCYIHPVVPRHSPGISFNGHRIDNKAIFCQFIPVSLLETNCDEMLCPASSVPNKHCGDEIPPLWRLPYVGRHSTAQGRPKADVTETFDELGQKSIKFNDIRPCDPRLSDVINSGPMCRPQADVGQMYVCYMGWTPCQVFFFQDTLLFTTSIQDHKLSCCCFFFFKV